MTITYEMIRLRNEISDLDVQPSAKYLSQSKVEINCENKLLRIFHTDYGHYIILLIFPIGFIRQLTRVLEYPGDAWRAIAQFREPGLCP